MNESYQCKASDYLSCIDNYCKCNSSQEYNKDSNNCEPATTCEFGAIAFKNKCYYFSSDQYKADDVKSEGCEKLEEKYGKSGDNKWKPAIVDSPEVRDMFMNHLNTIGSTEIYWLDKRDKNGVGNLNDDTWIENNKLIDYSICSSASGRTTEYMHFHINCFDDGLNGETLYNYICQDS